ncbi:hypothetical protein H5410_042110 [Solanum commersonii]|uniref:Uncharacterized protein n=1 Tax=Solanum commersonii TaxID=4109 RepID=A0A9J5XWL2_SOLCO|nr:hypothetical protein H5410_042110 [Solanum commersonii]
MPRVTVTRHLTPTRKLHHQLHSSSKESSTEFFPEIDLKRRSAFRRSRRSTTS